MPVHNILLELERAGVFLIDTDAGADTAPDNGWPEAVKGSIWYDSTLDKLMVNTGTGASPSWTIVAAQS